MPYSRSAAEGEQSVRCRATNLRVHYKNTYETVMAIQGMNLPRAKQYLADVIAHKDVIPFRVHTGGIGRNAQTKRHGTTQGRWPQKSCRVVLDLLTNAEANANDDKR